MRTLFWTFIACLGASLPAVAEYEQHTTGVTPGESRSLTVPSSKALTDALNACQIGRSGKQSRGPAVQPIQSKPITFSLTRPGNSDQGPFARENPRENPEFPGEEKYQACLKAVPTMDYFSCAAVLTTCHAETVDRGKTKIRPLSLDAGDPCSAGNEIYKMACGRGLEFARFSGGDVKCGPTQSPLLD